MSGFDHEPPLTAKIGGAMALLALGMAVAGAGYALFGASDDAGLIDPAPWPPRWFFWAVWVVLYPTIGVAGAYVWWSRDTVARAVFALSVVIGLAWVPVVQASGSRLVAPVVMDIAGLATALVAFVAAARASSRAAAWLTPSLVWGFATTLLKLWRLALNA